MISPGHYTTERVSKRIRLSLNSESEVDELLFQVQLEKSRLAQQKFRHTDTYKALAILEKVQVEQYTEILGILLTAANCDQQDR